MKLVNLTPHEITLVRPGGVAAACGAYHWEFFPEGTELPEDVLTCPCECMVGVEPLHISIPPSGKVARCQSGEERVGTLHLSDAWNGAVPVFKSSFGDVVVINELGNAEPFPEAKDGVIYITSSIVADALKRPDVVSPHVLRDEAGRVVGCDGFQTFVEA